MIDWIASLPKLVHALTLLVTSASLIASITPSKSDNVIVDFIAKCINVLGINVHKAKNADEL